MQPHTSTDMAPRKVPKKTNGRKKTIKSGTAVKKTANSAPKKNPGKTDKKKISEKTLDVTKTPAADEETNERVVKQEEVTGTAANNREPLGGVELQGVIVSSLYFPSPIPFPVEFCFFLLFIKPFHH